MDQNLRHFISNAGLQNSEMIIQKLEGAGYVNFDYLVKATIHDLVKDLEIGLHDAFKLFRRANNQAYPTDDELQLINQLDLTQLPIFPIDITNIQEKFYLLIVVGAPQSGKDTFISMCINTQRHVKYFDYIRYVIQKQSNELPNDFKIYYEQGIVFLKCPDPGQYNDFEEEQFSEQLYKIIYPLKGQIIDYRILYVDNSKVQRLGIQMIYSIQRTLEWITSLDKLILIQMFNNTKSIKGVLFMDKSPVADLQHRFQYQQQQQGPVDKIQKDRCIIADINLYQCISPGAVMLFDVVESKEAQPYMLALSSWNKNSKHIKHLLSNLTDWHRGKVEYNLRPFRQAALINQFEETFKKYLKHIADSQTCQLQMTELGQSILQFDESQLIHISVEKAPLNNKETIKAPIGAFFLICIYCKAICHKACKYGLYNSIEKSKISSHQKDSNEPTVDKKDSKSKEQLDLIKKCQKFNKNETPKEQKPQCASCVKRIPKCDGLAEIHQTVQQYTKEEIQIFKSYFLMSENRTKVQQCYLNATQTLTSKSELRVAQVQQLQNHKKKVKYLETLQALYKKELNHEPQNKILFNLQIRIDLLDILIRQNDQDRVKNELIINSYGQIIS